MKFIKPKLLGTITWEYTKSSISIGYMVIVKLIYLVEVIKYISLAIPLDFSFNNKVLYVCIIFKSLNISKTFESLLLSVNILVTFES